MAAVAGMDYGRLTPPPGCRLVLALCLLFFVLPTDIFSCSPSNVLDKWCLWTLCTTTYVHHELFSLLGGLVLGWRRFIRAENEHGTVGFMLWLLFTSAVIHAAYCVGCRLFFEFFDARLATQPVHGLWPLVCLLFTYDAKQDPFGEVLLWPLPVTVYTRTVPLLALFGAWVVHLDAHLDSIVAIFLAFALPFELKLSDAAHDAIESLLERHETHAAVLYLKNMEGFCTRNAGFKALQNAGGGDSGRGGFNSALPQTQANEFDFAGGDELDLEVGASIGAPNFGSDEPTFSIPGQTAKTSSKGAPNAVVAAMSSMSMAVGGGEASTTASSVEGEKEHSHNYDHYAGSHNQIGGQEAPYAAGADFLENHDPVVPGGASGRAAGAAGLILQTDFLNPSPPEGGPIAAGVAVGGDAFLAQHPVFDENINTRDIFGDLNTADNPFDL